MADIELQESSFKRAEKARMRNKLEERKLNHDLNRKHGLHETQKYRIQVMSEERKLIEKELEKIKTGLRKPPVADPFGAAEDPRGAGTKNDNAGKVSMRGRAMSIHHQSDKYDAVTPQVPLSNATHRKESLANNPAAAVNDSNNNNINSNSNGPARRQSFIPTLQNRNTGEGWRPRRTSVSQHPQQANGNSRKPSLIPVPQGPRKQSQLLPQAEVEQPSASELLEMAMKNAVMYAVKHVDKLKLDGEGDDDDNNTANYGGDDNDTDDGDVDDEYDSNDSNGDDTLSQYQRLVVVTKESDSDNDDADDINVETKSIKTIATLRSQASRKSLYAELGDSDDDSGSDSTHYRRSVSRTSTTLTGVSNIKAVAAKKKQRESENIQLSQTPRHAAADQKPSPALRNATIRKANAGLQRENTSSSFASSPTKRLSDKTPTGKARSLADASPRKTPHGVAPTGKASSLSVSESPRKADSRSVRREPTAVSFTDASSVTSGVTARSGRKNTFHVTDNKKLSVAAKSSGDDAKSRASRRSDVSPVSTTSKRSVPNNASKDASKKRTNGEAGESPVDAKSTRSGKAGGKAEKVDDDADKKSTKSGFLSPARADRTQLLDSEANRGRAATKRKGGDGGSTDRSEVKSSRSSVQGDGKSRPSSDKRNFLPDINK